MNEKRGDRFVWWFSLFVVGYVFGVWTTETPRFAACVEIPPKQMSYPVTKAEVQAFVKAYHGQDKGWKK